MTIRPTETAIYLMACDESDCGNYARVSTLADVRKAVNRCPQFSWERLETGRGLDRVVKHRCPKCAAASRRTAA